MQYTEEMILQSKSGYCMPFEEQPGKEVAMTLGYGEQTYPSTGEKFFHHGLDFIVNHYPLSAVASGTISGVGSDSIHGIYQTIRYGKYEVTYGHLANVYANFGDPVVAGQVVSLSSDRLHISVKFDGEELNPLEFLTMLYGNIKALKHQGRIGAIDIDDFDMNIATQYDNDREEIESLMLRYLPLYMDDLRHGQYALSPHRELSLRNIFSLGAMKRYFFEVMPSMSNPLGISQRSVPLACKVQNLLIGDFLDYLALRHNVFLSTLNEALKKKVHSDLLSSSGVIDPLMNLEVDIQSFDIPRIVSVYPDRAGVRWWTKAWFNNHENGESSVEIERQQAILFILDRIEKDEWLTEYFPKQMEVYHHAIEQTKEQLLNQTL